MPNFLQNLSREQFTKKYMINGEKNPEQVFVDVAEEISRVEKSNKRAEVQKTFFDMMEQGYFVPGGRILANARSYTSLKSRNYNNCFTIDIEDHMEGIYGAIYEDAMISRMGGGVGFDVSKLRPENSKTTNGGLASGPLSFLEVFNASAKTIQSGGQRRAAHIALLDISHPDVEKFITAKQGDNNEFLKQFNISVRITDAFMDAVEKDLPWDLTFNGKIYKTLPARDLYNTLARNAFEHNEPGVFFLDRVERDNNGWWAFKIDRCNPCGEITMPPYSLCCLGSLLLTTFIRKAFTPEAYFDFDKFAEVVPECIRFLDNVLDATQYPLEKIETFSKQWRRVGLGFMGLGSSLAMLGIPYDSEAAVAFTKNLNLNLQAISYRSSALLAKEKGMAPGLKSGLFGKVDKRLFESNVVRNLPLDVLALIKKYGLRNIGLNTTAPTGTTALTVGNNCSSGIEPMFALEYTRNYRTGKGDETVAETVYDYAYLAYLDYIKNGGEAWSPEKFKSVFVTTENIDPYKSIDVQAGAQQHIDHSISKTANLPKGYTFEQYKELFMYAYKSGLKGFTSFNPSGSMKGVLETNSDRPSDSVSRFDAPKRPDELPCDIHYVHANNQDFIVLVGKLKNMVYEIFVDEQNGHDFKDAKVGKIVKKGKGEYSLICDNGITVEGLSKNFTGSYGTLARMVSMSLRHGVPLPFVVEQLQRSKEFLGFEKAVSRVLKHYIKAEEAAGQVLRGPICKECNVVMVLKDGCPTCPNCGSSKCS